MNMRRRRRYSADHYKPCRRDYARWAWADYTKRLQELQRVAYTNLFLQDPK